MILFLTHLLFADEFQIANQTVQHQTLSNGLDMLWINDQQPHIDVYVVYAAGTYMENQPSLAHMTEHAMFCSHNGAFDKILKPHVQATNAYTRNEHTTYYSTNISTQSLPIVLSQEYQRMDGLDADQKCFDYEKARLEKEEEQNSNLVSDWKKKRRGLIFGDGYGGINDTKSELTLDDVRSFYNLWYQPNRASMVIVGDIDKNTWQEIQNIFSKLKNREAPSIISTRFEPTQTDFTYSLTKERRDWLWRGPSIVSSQEWLYWTIMSKAFLLERDNDGLDLTFDEGMMGSSIEMTATGQEGSKRLDTFYKRIEKGDVDEKLFQEAKKSFSQRLSDLSVRGRPYFTIASQLGYWAAWDQLPTLLQLMVDVQELSPNPTEQALSYIQSSQKSEIYNPKGEVGEIPDDPKKLNEAAELAQNSGDLSRAIACYQRLLELKPSKINSVIYHYYLGHLYLESGDKNQAKKALLKGLAIVDYPALRELLNEIDQETPHGRGEAVVQSDTSRLSFEGEIPPWAEKAAEVMTKLEKWRGLKFTEKVTIRFEEDAGYNAAGWYDNKTKALVVGKGGSERFGEGVMLHELYHALQDQQFDLGAIEKNIKSEDHMRAFYAVVEGEAMLAVAELMNYDFLSHVRYTKSISDDMFQKNFNYGEGMKFVQAIREKRGWDGVGTLYSDPPLSTAVILDPDRYLAGENALQVLTIPIKKHHGEKLLEIRSKGAYGWMLFLVQHAPESMEELLKLYRTDQYMRLEKDGTIYHRWSVAFESSRTAKRVQKIFANGNSVKRRKGKILIWEWE
ncbi:MAG: hypothetical protein CL916_13540 [Deltaproteobacteria bacterium]|nr:hypothetical protein [Deltaproteobacteria bacterium]